MRTIILVAALVILPAGIAAGQDDAQAIKGAALLTESCSRCHALTHEGASRHDKAPPFRDVVKRYPAESLAEALAEGIVTGHPDMPVMAFEPDAISAIIAYLNTLKPPALEP